MPELAEVKIMSEYVNHVTKDKVFSDVRKNPVNKNPEFKVQYQKFTIHSENRGKELRLIINPYPRIWLVIGLLLKEGKNQNIVI
jgi:hypothetical protein